MADANDEPKPEQAPESGAGGDGVQGAGPTDKNRTQRLTRASEARRTRVASLSLPLAQEEERRTKGLVSGRSKAGCAEPAVPDACGQAGSSLFLLFIEGTEGDARKQREDMVANNRACATEFADIRRHMAFLKASGVPAYPHDGYSRLKSHLRSGGYLKIAYPGANAIWRRSLYISAAAAVLLVVVLYILRGQGSLAATDQSTSSSGTLTVLDSEGSPLRQPASLRVGQQFAVRDGPGYVWLPTGDRGASTEVRLREGAKFSVGGNSQFSLDEGEATEVMVSAAATRRSTFVLSTKRAEVRTDGAVFGVETEEAATTVYVYTGSVIIRPISGGQTRSVPAGNGVVVGAGNAGGELFPLLEVSIESAPGRVLGVTMRNRSSRPIEVSKAIGPDDFPYWLSIDQDQAGYASTEPFREVQQAIPLPGGRRGGRVFGDSESHNGIAVLEPMSRGSQSMYQFSIDLNSAMAGADAADFTLVLEYRGRVLIPGIGAVSYRPMSRSIRFDTKRGSNE